MAYSQAELGRRFARGETTGTASNVELIEFADGSTGLVGYGWALYARRLRDGTTVKFGGWYGYSPSTSCQFARLGLHSADIVSDADPVVRTGSGSKVPRSAAVEGEHERESESESELVGEPAAPEAI